MTAAKLVIDPKKWLGDHKVLKMDWDVRGMHFHLMLLAWQNTPQGSIEAVGEVMSKYLNIDPQSQDWIERVKPQLMSVWQTKTLFNEHNEEALYYVQPGLLKEVERQSKPKISRAKKPSTEANSALNTLNTLAPNQGHEPAPKVGTKTTNNKAKIALVNSGFELLDAIKEEGNDFNDATASDPSHSLTDNSGTEDTMVSAISEEQRKNDSVTIWTLGAQLLVSESFSEQRARTFLGKLAKEYGATNLAAVIAQMNLKKTNPVEAKSYLIALLKNTQKPNLGQRVPHNQASGKLIL